MNSRQTAWIPFGRFLSSDAERVRPNGAMGRGCHAVSEEMEAAVDA